MAKISSIKKSIRIHKYVTENESVSTKTYTMKVTYVNRHVPNTTVVEGDCGRQGGNEEKKRSKDKKGTS